MKWLIDCSDLVMHSVPELPELHAPELVRPDVVINDNGEPLVPVKDALRLHPVYSWLGFDNASADVLMRAGLVERLVTASRALPKDFDIVVIDAYRTREFQAELLAYYQAENELSLTDAGYVSDPYSEVNVPPHVTGGAVDLTLGWRGAVLGLGTDFDDFSDAAAPAALEDRAPGLARDLRRLLASVLGRQGMVPITTEWWHWSYGDQYWARTTGEATAVYGEVI